VDVVLYQFFWCIRLSSFDVSILLVDKFFSLLQIFIIELGLLWEFQAYVLEFANLKLMYPGCCQLKDREPTREVVHCLESAKRNNNVNTNAFTTVFKIVESIRFVFLPTYWYFLCVCASDLYPPEFQVYIIGGDGTQRAASVNFLII
jgi:hypothetical protein